MQTGWLNKVTGLKVEHVPCPHPNVRVNLAAKAKGVLHTTEGSTIEGALAVFLKHDAPHFLVGRDSKHHVRVLQLIPLGQIAAALENHPGGVETNTQVRAQIEIVGFSQHHVWLPDALTTLALRDLIGALHVACGIPNHHVANPKRGLHAWQAAPGWFGHDGVPENIHWDPGMIDWPHLFPAVSPTPDVKPKPKPIIPLGQTWRLVRRSNGLVYVEQGDTYPTH